MNAERVLGTPECLREHVGFLGVRHENAVELNRRALVHASLLNPHKRLLLEIVEDHERRSVLRDAREYGEILDDTNRMTLRSLDRADEAPRSAVELARRQKLTGLLDRSLNAAEMADRRMLGETTENL